MIEKNHRFTTIFFRLTTSLLVYFFVGVTPVLAQACDPTCTNAIECQDKIRKCQEAWNQMEAAKKPHVETLRKIESYIAAFQSRIKSIESDLIKKAQAIAEGEKELAGFIDLATRRIRQFYIHSFTPNPYPTFFSSTNIGAFLRAMMYDKVVTNEDKKAITQTALSVKDHQDRKKNLEDEKNSLPYLKTETDRRAESVRKLVGDAEAYQSKLTATIANLTS